MSKWQIVLAAMLLAVGSVQAVDPADVAAPTADAPDRFAAARGHIKATRWSAAIVELKRLDSRSSADWNNLMGFAHRKLTPPDLAAAEAYYDAAIRLAPAHLGALEYSGELYLMKGELARAEQRLAQLRRACGGPCEEQADLQRAIDRFKANGNRFVAELR